jgi:hypothetical protein
MKRRDLEIWLKQQGCILHHHGGKHEFWINLATAKRTPLPRHNEIRNSLARAVCDQLGVARPRI